MQPEFKHPRDVPSNYSHRRSRPAKHGVRKDPSCRVRWGPSKKRIQRLKKPFGQAMQEHQNWRPHQHKSRRDGHQQNVLDHMEGKQFVVKASER